MPFQRRLFLKWTWVTLLCGSCSFVFGTMLEATIAAMLAAMATIIFMMTAIESHPRFQRERQQNQAFSSAVHLGLKIRICWAVYILLCFGSLALHLFKLPMFLGFPLILEGLIGSLAAGLWNFPPIKPAYNTLPPITPPATPDFLHTYLASMTTAAIHILLLALLCAVIYGILRYRARRQAARTSE